MMENLACDAGTDDKCLLYLDAHQDCEDFKYDVKGNLTRFVFKRKFDTCDLLDYTMEEGTTHIVWATGLGKLEIGRSLCDEEESGTAMTTLLRVEIEPNITPDTWKFTAAMSKLKVPSADTTYFCKLFQLPRKITQSLHHLIRFEPLINQGHEVLVHHMELFHCEMSAKEKLLSYSGPCPKVPKKLEACKKVLAAWAMGASPFNYPKEAGLLLGGKEYSRYVLLEIHYNNPQLKNDWVDSSGLTIYLTPNLRQYDAGVIELGLEYTDKMAIPPEQPHFQLTGYCIAECTSVGIPYNGINIFASQLHTHLTGVKVETTLVKKEAETSRINWDNHYSPHYQEIRLLRKKILIKPGDALLTRCTYNTLKKKNITLGGFATTDEMCVNYVYYYPKINLEVCKSSISDEDLANYFNKLNRFENLHTSAHMPISESYKNIEWTPIRVTILDKLYQRSQLYMQCNKSDGERFPGMWNSMPLTTVIHHLPSTPRCTDN